MKIDTHAQISTKLCGTPLKVGDDSATVSLTTPSEMAVDHTGLVHGGFIFGLADHAAMLAVNHPNVVLGGSSVRFIKPVKAGDTVVASAVVDEIKGNRRTVNVIVKRQESIVFEGRFDCFVLNQHVLA